ncbi:MAG: DUF3987 domain-containing protein [Alphaproteobacteria bacterium]|nr:DUF3987 domain-containing protein [Alphaproteobacteria bacterium]
MINNPSFDEKCRAEVQKEELNFDWKAPIPFEDDALSDLCAGFLPTPLKEYVEAVSNNLHTPIGMGIFGAFSALSVALQKKTFVKVSDTYLEPLNLYLLTIMEPGCKKTANINMFRNVILKYEEETINKSEFGKSPQYIVNDTTLESLIDCLIDNNEKMGIISDEGGAFRTWSGLYTKGITNIDVLLKGWDGGYIRLKRKDRNQKINPFLTIYVSTQPFILEDLINNREFVESGFLDRFLYFSKEIKLEDRIKRPVPITQNCINEYEKLIFDLLKIKDQHFLTLAKDAFELWWNFKTEIEYRKEPTGDLFDCIGWASKLAGHTLRIAGLFQMIEHRGYYNEIDYSTMNNAISLAKQLIPHAKNALCNYSFFQKKQIRKSQVVWLAIKKMNTPYFTQTEITTKLKHNMPASLIKKCLLELIEHQFISEPIVIGTKNKAIQYYVNPKALP